MSSNAVRPSDFIVFEKVAICMYKSRVKDNGKWTKKERETHRANGNVCRYTGNPTQVKGLR